MLLLVVRVHLELSVCLDWAATESTDLELGLTFPSCGVWNTFALNFQLTLHAVLVSFSALITAPWVIAGKVAHYTICYVTYFSKYQTSNVKHQMTNIK